MSDLITYRVKVNGQVRLSDNTEAKIDLDLTFATESFLHAASLAANWIIDNLLRIKDCKICFIVEEGK